MQAISCSSGRYKALKKGFLSQLSLSKCCCYHLYLCLKAVLHLTCCCSFINIISCACFQNGSNLHYRRIKITKNKYHVSFLEAKAENEMQHITYLSLLGTQHCWLLIRTEVLPGIKFQHTHAKMCSSSCPFRTALPELSEQGYLLRKLQQNQDCAHKVKVLSLGDASLGSRVLAQCQHKTRGS